MGDRQTVSFRTSPDLWREVKITCAQEGIKINDWMNAAMEEKLAREQEERLTRLLGNSRLDIPQTES